MDNNKLIEVLYATSIACSQALLAYVQVRAQQEAVKGLDEKQIEQMLAEPTTYSGLRRPIGFAEN